MNSISLNILKSKEDILRALLESKISKSVIGITSRSLGPGTYLTSVVELLIGANDDTTIVLKEYDITGYFFDRNALKIDEIDNVIPFKAPFQNPFLKDFRRAPLASDDIQSNHTA